MVRLMQRCLGHDSAEVIVAALQTLQDMVASYGNAMLAFERLGNGSAERGASARAPSLLMGIVRLTRHGTPGVAKTADIAARWVWTRLRTGRGRRLAGCWA